MQTPPTYYNNPRMQVHASQMMLRRQNTFDQGFRPQDTRKQYRHILTEPVAFSANFQHEEPSQVQD
jgi:hypothetical protein